MSPRILLLHTGGTLGMRPRQPDRALAPDEFASTVLEHVPELEELAQVETQVLSNLDSTDLTPEHWMQLAEAIRDAGDRFRGIVITHGTDAMATTAAALSYVLRDLPFPVVLTGSQRPLADVQTDGRANLVGAVDLALRGIREVSIYFDGVLLRGNRAVKRSTFDFGAFHSPNHPALAEVGVDVRLLAEEREATGTFRLEGGFDPRVCVLWLTPGSNAEALRALLDTELQAVLLLVPGSGNIPVESEDVADSIRALTQRGMTVAIGSQARRGGTNLRRYAGGRKALDAGASSIGDMTIEAAAVKLMYLCAAGLSGESMARALVEPIAGEITPTANERGATG